MCLMENQVRLQPLLVLCITSVSQLQSGVFVSEWNIS